MGSSLGESKMLCEVGLCSQHKAHLASEGCLSLLLQTSDAE